MWLVAAAFVVFFAQALFSRRNRRRELHSHADCARPVHPAGRYRVRRERSHVSGSTTSTTTCPTGAIAQVPAEPRDASRLLVLDRSEPAALEHATFRDIGTWLRPGDLLVVNDSRVIPARLPAKRAGGALPRCSCCDLSTTVRTRGRPSCVPRAACRWAPRSRSAAVTASRWGSACANGDPARSASTVTRTPSWPQPARCRCRPTSTPVPRRPSATRPSTPARQVRRPPPPPGCTSRRSCSPARGRGIRRASVTLHVGPDTFRPLEAEHVHDHLIHRELYEIPEATHGRCATPRSGRCGRHHRRPGARDRRPLRRRIGLDGPVRHAAVSVRRGECADHELPPAAQLAAVARHGLRAGRHRPRVARPSKPATPCWTPTAWLCADGYRFFSFGDAMLIV